MAAVVAVLGASINAERYSNQAVKLLLDKGFNVIPVNPSSPQIYGIKATGSLSDINIPVDTLTLYVNPRKSSEMEEEILSLKPRRIIFNPGTENRHLAENAVKQGIEVVEACTLVMLRTSQF